MGTQTDGSDSLRDSNASSNTYNLTRDEQGNLAATHGEEWIVTLHEAVF